jgi:geranylgeranyl pyrophosphate synthase
LTDLLQLDAWLVEQRTAIDAAIQAIVDRTLRKAPDADHQIVGRVYRSIRAYVRNDGRRLHGATLLLAHAAAGGSERDCAVRAAAAYQLYHHHTLVHDDIYDEDATRRGQATIYRAFANLAAGRGVPDDDIGRTGAVFATSAVRQGAVAACAHGKIVHALAFDALIHAGFPASLTLEVVAALHWHDLDDNAGQLKDVWSEGNGVPDPEACLAIARQKTGELFGRIAHAGAMLAGASVHVREALRDWGVAVGTAYQLQDDLADLVQATEKGQGRGIGTDLRSRKPTFVLSMALRHGELGERIRLERWLSGHDSPSLDEILWLIRRTGAVERCEARIAELVQRARRGIERDRDQLESGARERMAALASYVTSDTYWRRPLGTGQHPLDPAL